MYVTWYRHHCRLAQLREHCHQVDHSVPRSISQDLVVFGYTSRSLHRTVKNRTHIVMFPPQNWYAMAFVWKQWQFYLHFHTFFCKQNKQIVLDTANFVLSFPFMGWHMLPSYVRAEACLMGWHNARLVMLNCSRFGLVVTCWSRST